MKFHSGFVRDHSGSMSSLVKGAVVDYNSQAEFLRQDAIENSTDSYISIVECGYGQTDKARVVVDRSAITVLKNITQAEYTTRGTGTPLWDSVILLLETMKKYDDGETIFLANIQTDGGENSSHWSSQAKAIALIQELRLTDRFTVTFRVPRGYARNLVKAGVDEGNILEWDTTTRGLATAQQQNMAAMKSFTAAIRSGTMKSTTKFYANLSEVKTEDVQATLDDISSQVTIWPVTAADVGRQIRDFVESRLGGDKMLKGAAFYQLVKTEAKVQPSKLIMIRDKDSGAVYAGPAARNMLGLPHHSDVRLAPDALGKWQVYIQSTSVNRKIDPNSQLIYWPLVGVKFTEGPSA